VVSAQCQTVAQPRVGSVVSSGRHQNQGQGPSRNQELLVRRDFDLTNKTLAIAATSDRIVFCRDLTNRKEGHNGQNNRDRRA
jgi:hypothetical protein